MKDIKWLAYLIMLVLPIGCTTIEKTASGETNPAQPGFNASGSDPKAIEIADQVMMAMGGRDNWDNTHYIKWNYFGKRTLVWDKWKNRVRIEFNDRPLKILVDVPSMTGAVQQNNKVLEHPDSIRYYVERGRNVWINDSYWLVMPFKMKDSGVTLRYIGQKNNELGVLSDVVALTFDSIGVTPRNKYHVYVNPSSHLVTQWDFFPDRDNEQPEFSSLWGGYGPYGNIVLSNNRGKSGTLTNIAVYEYLPDSVFTSFSFIDWTKAGIDPKKKKKK